MDEEFSDVEFLGDKVGVRVDDLFEEGAGHKYVVLVVVGNGYGKIKTECGVDQVEYVDVGLQMEYNGN